MKFSDSFREFDDGFGTFRCDFGERTFGFDEFDNTGQIISFSLAIWVASFEKVSIFFAVSDTCLFGSRWLNIQVSAKLLAKGRECPSLIELPEDVKVGCPTFFSDFFADYGVS